MEMDFVQELARLLDRSAVQEIKVKFGDSSVKVRRGYLPGDPDSGLPGHEAAEPAAGAAADEQPGEVVVPSGLVGIYRAAEGIAEGSVVSEGQLLGFIESMRLMNEVASPAAGKIARMIVQDGSPVEYGQTLMTLVKQ